MHKVAICFVLLASAAFGANELTVLECEQLNGVEACRVLFLYAITTPIQVGGANVVPTPSSGLPPLAATILAAGEKTALDDGTAAFQVIPFGNYAGLSGAALLTELRRIYAARETEYLANYATKYARAGDRFDK